MEHMEVKFKEAVSEVVNEIVHYLSKELLEILSQSKRRKRCSTGRLRPDFLGRKKLKQRFRKVSVFSRSNIPGDPNTAKNSNNAYDEEENYETSTNTGIKIKVEPGLTDDMYQNDEPLEEDSKDFLARLKQEVGADCLNQEECLDSIMDIENPTYIKKENESYPNSPHADIKIKTEPDLSDDDASVDFV